MNTTILKTRIVSLLMLLTGIPFLFFAVAGCAQTVQNNSRKASSGVFSLEMTGPVVICIAFDAVSDTVEHWAAAENQIDWDGDNEQPKHLCTASYAAVELKTYLQKMHPGLMVTLMDQSAVHSADFLIGLSDAATGITSPMPRPTAPESYTIAGVPSKDKQTLVIAGFDRAGMLYGTYELLDRLGVRWFGPQPWQEVVPARSSLTLTDLPITSAPSFTNQRGFHDETQKGTPEMFVWMARNKLNLWSYQEDLYPLQRKLCLLIAGGAHTWKDLLHPTGIKDQQGRTLFDVHPDWFAMIDGKRTSEEYQPCVSNSEGLAYMLHRFIDQLQQSPYRHCDIINFWPYDSHKPWCQCPNCDALGNDTDKYMYAVAEINKGLKHAYAQGQIQRLPRLGLCAYDGTETTQPPSKPAPAGFDDAMNYFTFFPIRRCYAHTLDDPSCTELNAGYARQFEGWSQSPYKGDIVAGEYYNVSRYESLPLLFYRTVPHDMRYYYRHHARGFNYMHATCGQWGTRTLTNWRMAKLCWDVDADANDLLTEFFDGYFGPAADRMRQVFDDIADGYANIAAWRSWHKKSVWMQLKNSLSDPTIKTPFILNHLQQDTRAAGNNSAISVAEGQQKLDAASEKLLSILSMDLPEETRTRIEEIQWHLRYGRLSYQFYTHMSQILILDRSGQTAEAKAEFDKARPIADELKKNEFIFLDVTGNADWLSKTLLKEVFSHYAQKYGEPSTPR